MEYILYKIHDSIYMCITYSMQTCIILNISQRGTNHINVCFVGLLIVWPQEVGDGPFENLLDRLSLRSIIFNFTIFVLCMVPIDAAT